MFSHVMVGSNDIQRSKRFYDAVLAVLGADAGFEDQTESGHTRLFYQHDGSFFAVAQPINDAPASVANGGTIGFSCSSAAQVVDFHAAALAHGGTAIEDPPGPRQSKMGVIHLAYVRDPDGNKLCALYREA